MFPERILHHRRVSSTQEVVSRFLPSNRSILAWADSQESGKGRRGRSWNSPPGGLYYSFWLPESSGFTAPTWSLITAHSWVEYLRDRFPDLPLGIKWPNDIVCEGRKLAGILSKTSKNGILIGVGINVNNDPGSDESLRRPATSLYEETGEACSRRNLLFGWTERFSSVRDDPPDGSCLETNIETIGKTVKSEQGTGQATGLYPDGSLELRDSSGSKIRVYDNELIEIKDGAP